MSRNPSVDRFKRDMQDLSVQLANNIGDTLSLQADELMQDMADAIEHSVSGNLKKSIRKKDVTKKIGDVEIPSFLVMAGGPLTTKHEKSGPHDYSLDEEFGTRKESPRPFFFGTARRYLSGALEDWKQTLSDTIKENNEMRANRSSVNWSTGDFSFSSRQSGGAVTIIKGKR